MKKNSKKTIAWLFKKTAILFMLVMPMMVRAQNENKQSDQFEKVYQVHKSTSIFFKNKIGDLKIETWDKSEVKLVVRYSIVAKKQERC